MLHWLPRDTSTHAARPDVGSNSQLLFQKLSLHLVRADAPIAVVAHGHETSVPKRLLEQPESRLGLGGLGFCACVQKAVVDCVVQGHRATWWRTARDGP